MQVLHWVPSSVILLRKTLQGTLDLSRSVQQLFIHRFLLHPQLHINNSTKHKKLIFFIIIFSRLFLDYLLVENMPISIVNWERTTLKWSDGDPTNSSLVRCRNLTCLNFQNWKNIIINFFERNKNEKSQRLGSIINILQFWQQGT